TSEQEEKNKNDTWSAEHSGAGEQERGCSQFGRKENAHSLLRRVDPLLSERGLPAQGAGFLGHPAIHHPPGGVGSGSVARLHSREAGCPHPQEVRPGSLRIRPEFRAWRVLRV